MSKDSKNLGESKETREALDASYKQFWKSPAGKDFKRWLEKSSEGAVQTAKMGVGVATTQEGTKQVQLSVEQQLGMLQRSFAYDQAKAYIKRRVDRGRPKLATE